VSGFDRSSLVRDYGDPFDEARTCRIDCALFDFSFVNRARIHGDRALDVLHQFQPRNLLNLAPGRIAYSVKLDDSNFVKSDLTIWRIGKDTYEVMSGNPQDIMCLARLSSQLVEFDDLSQETSIFALQGPSTLKTLKSVADLSKVMALPYFGHCETNITGILCVIGRLGYTGERGIEIIAPRTHHEELWQTLIKRANPAGFAAIDILRIEAGFWLFTNECLLDASAADLGVEHLVGGASTSRRYKLVCFQAECEFEPILWQPDTNTLAPPEKNEITITSACKSVVCPSIVGLGLINANSIENALVNPNGSFHNIRLTSLPLYDPNKRIPPGNW